ncbi:MAG: hypothetical protein KDD82_08515 [Planctomycetes bacterium]|nr:hypothetical protein [Planctomycetota bacterium]
MKRSGWVKLWVLIVLLALGAGSFAVVWFSRYQAIDIVQVEADLALAMRAMQKTARAPEAMIAVRQQQQRLRLAREFNAALGAGSDGETLRHRWEAYAKVDAEARESLSEAARSAQLSTGDRW